jgi:hypothetical protein
LKEGQKEEEFTGPDLPIEGTKTDDAAAFLENLAPAVPEKTSVRGENILAIYNRMFGQAQYCLLPIATTMGKN